MSRISPLVVTSAMIAFVLAAEAQASSAALAKFLKNARAACSMTETQFEARRSSNRDWEAFDGWMVKGGKISQVSASFLDAQCEPLLDSIKSRFGEPHDRSRHTSSISYLLETGVLNFTDGVSAQKVFFGNQRPRNDDCRLTYFPLWAFKSKGGRARLAELRRGRGYAQVKTKTIAKANANASCGSRFELEELVEEAEEHCFEDEEECGAAAGLFQKACDCAVGDGCARLGTIHMYGRGVEKDLARTEVLYQRVCDLKWAPYCTILADMMNPSSPYHRDAGALQNNPKRAAKLYQKACDIGYNPGCLHLGLMYMEGSGVSKDVERGVELLQGACESENRLYFMACLRLSELLLEGRDGVVRDKDLAAQFYKDACEEWYPDTMERCLAVRSSLGIEPGKWDKTCQESREDDDDDDRYQSWKLTCDDGIKYTWVCRQDSVGSRYCNTRWPLRAECRAFCPQGTVGLRWCKKECD